MPFAELPSSQGFVRPQAPDWGGFALAAIHELDRRPFFNTAEAVNQAVGQIDKILQLSSPVARMQRQLQMQQLQTMSQVYRDYQLHPENYMLTANGPVRIDPYKRLEQASRVSKNAAMADYLTKKTNPQVPQFIKDRMNLLNNAINAERNGQTIPPSQNTAPSAPADNTPAGTTEAEAGNDTTDADIALSNQSETEDNEADLQDSYDNSVNLPYVNKTA